MSTYEDFFQRYRELVALEESFQQRQRDLETKYREDREQLHADHRRCAAQVSTMRRTITAMIDKGWDPVEAQLKMDEDMHDRLSGDTLWDKDPFRENMRIDNSGNWGIGTITPLTLSGINSITMGPTGAIGAQGSITSTMGANGGYQAGYGPTPPSSMHPGVTADMKGFVDGHGDYHATDSGNGYGYEAYRTYDNT